MLTLEQIKDEVANDLYGVLGWFMLTDAQKTTLIDKVADAWADQKVRNITSGNMIQGYVGVKLDQALETLKNINQNNQ